MILGAALVLDETLALTGAAALEVTRAGLREGVFFASRLLDGASPLISDVRSTAIRNLAALHSPDLRRAEHVAELALALYDSLAEAAVVQLGDEERRLLWSAAMLHDVGIAIDYDGNPAHARYIVLNSDLPGHGPREVALLAQIVRYQRKGAPGLDDLEALARPRDHELVTRCAAILRLTTQLAAGDDRAIAGRLVPAAHGLRLVVDGDDRHARRVVARQGADDTFRRRSAAASSLLSELPRRDRRPVARDDPRLIREHLAATRVDGDLQPVDVVVAVLAVKARRATSTTDGPAAPREKPGDAVAEALEARAGQRAPRRGVDRPAPAAPQNVAEAIRHVRLGMRAHAALNHSPTLRRPWVNMVRIASCRLWP